MSRLLSLGLFAAASMVGSGASAEPGIGSRIDDAPGSVARPESTDEAAARRVMRTYAGCVARNRRRWAEGALALPFNGREQNAYILRGIGGSDNCMGWSGLALRFRAPSLLAGMAEQLITSRFASASLDPIAVLADADVERAGLAARNGNEFFALCVVRRDPAMVRGFLATSPAGPEERAAGRRLVPHLGACLYQGQTLNFDPSALRALLAPALYRALVALTAPQGRN